MVIIASPDRPAHKGFDARLGIVSGKPASGALIPKVLQVERGGLWDDLLITEYR